MDANERPRVLCVDDEPNVLDGLKLHLRRRFQVETATGGAEGLGVLQEKGPFAVVVSDMRMPGMSGAVFLAKVREGWPDTVRMLLTGASDFDSAIAAVNEGQIFRFLSKPCPAELMVAAVQAAAEQHRLITAERVLLEQTLHGSIKTLTDILAIAHPASFGRATRAKNHISDLAGDLGVTTGRWELEIAAMLSQIGCITLPPAVVEKLYHGLALTERENAMAERIPVVAENLLSNIPRLEGVREILRCQDRRFSGVGWPKDEKRGEDLPLGSRMLKLVLDFDALEARGLPEEVTFDTLRGREGWYDPGLLEIFARIRGNRGKNADVHEIGLRALRPGMILAEDVCTLSGGLLIARGHQVTEGLLERIRNFYDGQGVKEPIRVVFPGDRPDGEEAAAERVTTPA